MTIASGTFLGPYQIVNLVGSGGMGKVYRARDSRLGRHVAIKVLHFSTASDRDRLTRFEREARLASSLNHPNIVTIYDVGEQDSTPYIAMELIEGKTLRELIPRGSLSLRDVVSIAIQVADALSKAHDSGIVHRDLKPENVMVTRDGFAKILDFGLGKTAIPTATFADSTMLAAPDPTNPGTILGTVDYMSPEQASGREIDFRSDQFSLGSILYELLTSRRPFRRETVVQTMAAIIADPPPMLDSLNASVPQQLRDVVSRCLQKNPDQRYSATRDLMADLQEIGATAEVRASGISKVAMSPYSRRWPLTGVRPVLYFVAIAVITVVAALSVVPETRETLVRAIWFREPLPASKNVVVLPFHAVDGNVDHEQFAAGLTSVITAALTQLSTDPSLQVSPSSEVNSRHITTAEEARKILGANLVLGGRIERQGEAVRVSWTVEDTATNRRLRAARIVAGTSEPAEIEIRTIDSIVSALGFTMKPADRETLLRDSRVPAAKEAYLRALGYLQDYDKEENITHAIALLEEARTLDPNYARAHAALGDAYWRRFDRTRTRQYIDPAEESCRKALATDERLAAAHACMGNVHFALGRYEDGLKEFNLALEREPTNDDFRRQAARVQDRLGKTQEAERTLQEAIKLRPHYWANYNVLGGFYFNQAKYIESAQMYSEVIKLAPDTSFGYANLGAAYLALGRYNDAISLFERSAAMRPTVTAYSNLGTAYFNRRRFLEAAETFEKAIKIDEQSYAVWGNLGDAYYWAPAKRDDAPAAYRKAIALGENEVKINPRDATLLSRIAGYQAMIGEKESALSYLKRALEIAPKDPTVRFKAALIHNQFNDEDGTIEWLEKAAEVGYSISTIRDVKNFDHLWTYPRFQELIRKSN